MTSDYPTFGQMIRALRLGWTFAYRRKCWVRVSDVPGGFDVDMHPPGLVPTKNGHTKYRVMRDAGMPIDDLLDMDERLRTIQRITKPVRVFVSASDAIGEL